MANGNGNGNGEEGWRRSRYYKEDETPRIDWIKEAPEPRDLPSPAYRKRTVTKPPKEIPQQSRSVLQRAREFVRTEVKPAIQKEVDWAERKKQATQRLRQATGEFVPAKKKGRGKGKTPKGRVPKRIPKRMRVQRYVRATGGIARPFEEPVYAEDLMGVPYGGEEEVGYSGGATDVLYHGEEYLGGGGYGESFLDLEGHLDDISRMGEDMLANPFEVPRRRPRRKR